MKVDVKVNEGLKVKFNVKVTEAFDLYFNAQDVSMGISEIIQAAGEWLKEHPDIYVMSVDGEGHGGQGHLDLRCKRILAHDSK